MQKTWDTCRDLKPHQNSDAPDALGSRMVSSLMVVEDLRTVGQVIFELMLSLDLKS
jgi:hypothetical protein